VISSGHNIDRSFTSRSSFGGTDYAKGASGAEQRVIVLAGSATHGGAAARRGRRLVETMTNTRTRRKFHG
jgi:hypothetical protein